MVGGGEHSGAAPLLCWGRIGPPLGLLGWGRILPPADPSAPRSLEQMLASNPGKTPISLLQEYGTRIGKTPVYDLLKAEGQAHQPNFTFRVTVGDIGCTGQCPPHPAWRGPAGTPVSRCRPRSSSVPPAGQGPSKKAAKHKAAEVALKLLKGGNMLEPAVPEEPR